MHRLLISILVALRVLSPESSFIITHQSPKSVSLLNPITEECLAEKNPADCINVADIRSILISDMTFEEKVNPLAQINGFLPDVVISYQAGLNIYIDFIFKTAMIQNSRSKESQYLQLSDYGNLRLLELVLEIYPEDDFLKVVLEGEKARQR
jgi:hypothetical protein